jgi:hypothetical protein
MVRSIGRRESVRGYPCRAVCAANAKLAARLLLAERLGRAIDEAAGGAAPGGPAPWWNENLHDPHTAAAGAAQRGAFGIPARRRDRERRSRSGFPAK